MTGEGVGGYNLPMNKAKERQLRRLSLIVNGLTGAVSALCPPIGVVAAYMHKASVICSTANYLQNGIYPIQGVQTHKVEDALPTLLRRSLRKTYLAVALGAAVSLGMNGGNLTALLLNKKLFDKVISAYGDVLQKENAAQISK